MVGANEVVGIASTAARRGWRGRRTARIALAAALVAAAPLVGAGGRDGAETTEVPAVARDLPPGHVLDTADLVPVRLPAGALPDGALTGVEDLTGARLAGAVRRGELLTDARLAGRSGDAHPPGPRRVVPVPLADAAVADLLAAGDLVDLVSPADPGAPDGPDGARPVARSAVVRDVPAGRPGGHRSILVEVPESDAARVAATAAGSPLAVLVHG